MLAGMAAAGLSGALVLGHATNTTAMVQLANTVIGIGGQGDPTSAHVPAKLSGTVVPTIDDYHYFPVHYPASVALDSSRDVAVPIVHEYLTNTGKNETHLIVAGYSLGTMAAEQERRNLQALNAADAPSRDQLTFVMIASPFAGNGGIFGRFPGLGIPGVTSGMGAAQPSRYDTTYSAIMYDTYADFPAYFNPLSLLNSALSIRYGHPDAFYDPIDPATSYAYLTKVDDPVTGSKDRYILYYNPHLPLLGPLRELASLTQTSAIAEPMISAFEPLLRVLVDMSYTDRVNANPSASVPFSFITPPVKFVEALAAMPGALAQGVANSTSGGHATVTPPNPIGNLVPVPVVPLASPEVPGSQARIALAPAPEQDVPKLKLDETPVKPPSSTAPTTSPVTVSTSSSDGRHPTLTSDGNKFAPGTDGATSVSTTTTTTTTTTTSTTTSVTPPAPTAPDPTPVEPASDGTDSGTAAAA
jgi:hypothetical protein